MPHYKMEYIVTYSKQKKINTQQPGSKKNAPLPDKCFPYPSLCIETEVN